MTLSPTESYGGLPQHTLPFSSLPRPHLWRERTMRWLCTGTLLVLTAAHALGAQAPQGRIAGQVTSGESDRPIEVARVVVDGTRLGAATRADGRYLIVGVPAGTHRVRVSMLGFA